MSNHNPIASDPDPFKSYQAFQEILHQAVNSRTAQQNHQYIKINNKNTPETSSIVSKKSDKSNLREIAEISQTILEDLRKKLKEPERIDDLKIQSISNQIFEYTKDLIDAKKTKNEDFIQKLIRGMTYFFTAITIVGLPATWYLLKKQSERETEIENLMKIKRDLEQSNADIQRISQTNLQTKKNKEINNAKLTQFLATTVDPIKKKFAFLNSVPPSFYDMKISSLQAELHREPSDFQALLESNQTTLSEKDKELNDLILKEFASKTTALKEKLHRVADCLKAFKAKVQLSNQSSVKTFQTQFDLLQKRLNSLDAVKNSNEHEKFAKEWQEINLRLTQLKTSITLLPYRAT